MRPGTPWALVALHSSKTRRSHRQFYSTELLRRSKRETARRERVATGGPEFDREAANASAGIKGR
jgi:hypothetical protein